MNPLAPNNNQTNPQSSKKAIIDPLPTTDPCADETRQEEAASLENSKNDEDLALHSLAQGDRREGPGPARRHAAPTDREAPNAEIHTMIPQQDQCAQATLRPTQNHHANRHLSRL